MYKRTIWQDHVEGVQAGTDLNAANLNNIEAGLMETSALAAMNAATQRYCYDMAKNAEVTTIYAELVSGVSTYVNIPTSAFRNNDNYQVAVEFKDMRAVNNAFASIQIGLKQKNGFWATLSAYDEPDDGVNRSAEVYFHITGGMI